MLKKSFAIVLLAAALSAEAQDISTLKNAADVYGGTLLGTSRYNAMAGATGAMGGDVSTLNSNPAGIGIAITSDFSGTLSVQRNRNSSSLYGSTTDFTSKHTDIGQVGGVAAFELNGKTGWKFVNLGVNFSNKSIDSYVESAGANSINFNIGNDNAAFNRHAYDRIGDMSKTSIGVGANYDNRIYIGTGVNIHDAHIEQSDIAQLTYASDKASEIFRKQYTPYTEDGTGVSASLGVIGKINNQFRLGAALETPVFWNIDRAYKYYDDVNSSDDNVYSETRKYQTPTKATLSAAYVPTKNLAVNVDYSIGLTKPKFKAGDADLEDELNDFYSGYKNQSEVKIGAEYRIQAFRIRGGYAFATNPFDTRTINVLGATNTAGTQSFDNLIAGKSNTFGAGIGYDFRSFYIDAAYYNVSSTYSNPFLKGSDQAGSQYYSDSAFVSNDAAIVSSVKNRHDNFSVTLGWKF